MACGGWLLGWLVSVAVVRSLNKIESESFEIKFKTLRRVESTTNTKTQKKFKKTQQKAIATQCQPSKDGLASDGY